MNVVNFYRRIRNDGEESEDDDSVEPYRNIMDDLIWQQNVLRDLQNMYKKSSRDASDE